MKLPLTLANKKARLKKPGWNKSGSLKINPSLKLQIYNNYFAVTKKVGKD